MINLSFSCPEKVNDMTKTECGNFCAACQIEVYDFRGKTNEEIKEILVNDPSIKCGSFDKSQAKEDVKTKVNIIFRLAFAAIFILGFNVNILFGQDSTHFESDIKINHQVDHQTIQFTGTVFDVDGERLPFVKVWIEIDSVFKSVGVTDFDGNFTLEVSNEFLGQKADLHFRFIGYNELVMNAIPLEQKQYVLEVHMDDNNTILTGILVIEDKPLFDVRDPNPKTVISRDDLKHRP